MVARRWLLDTALIAETSRRNPSEKLLRWLDREQFNCAVSVVTIDQLATRIEASADFAYRRHLERWLQGVCTEFIVIPYDKDCALLLGREQARLKETGIQYPRDCLELCACAVVHSLVILTQSVSDYPLLNGLQMEVWS
jgi:predicted nucleic acid-binding protein